MAGTDQVAYPTPTRQQVLRTALIAALCTILLVICGGATPHAGATSRLQNFGALQSEGLPMMVSHRGAALAAPENTLAAIQVAAEQGATAVELDVRLAADHVPVLFHDATLQRTTDGIGLVNFKTSEQLAALDAGSWFSPEFAGERVPTLSAAIGVLENAPMMVFLELKDEWTEAQLAPVVDELRSRILLHRVVLQSFEVGTLEALQRIAPEFARVLLTRELGADVTQRALDLGVSGVGAKTSLFAAFPQAAAEMRAQGLGTAVYTLNSVAEWDFAAQFGFDLVISDDPQGYALWRSARALADQHLPEEATAVSSASGE